MRGISTALPASNARNDTTSWGGLHSRRVRSRDFDAEARVIADGGFEKRDGADRLLVRHDRCERDARGIVDTDMDELPADAATAALAYAVPGDAIANALETAKFLAINMDQFARMLPLVAPHWSGQIESAEAVQAQPLQDPAADCP